MKTFSYTINDEIGIHARPAGNLAKLAKGFAGTRITIEKGGKSVDVTKLIESIENIIRTQLVNAEYAVAKTSDNFSEMFAGMDDAYMQARATDVKDISNRIIACLICSDEIKTQSGEKVIICADDLAPSETVSLDKEKVLAFVTAFGSSNSHTAILARNMNIPAVIGAGEEFLNSVKM